jgi:hypothetical protein
VDNAGPTQSDKFSSEISIGSAVESAARSQQSTRILKVDGDGICAAINDCVWVVAHNYSADEVFDLLFQSQLDRMDDIYALRTYAGFSHNAVQIMINRKPYIIASRDIAAGEEIFHPYGKWFWSHVLVDQIGRAVDSPTAEREVVGQPGNLGNELLQQSHMYAFTTNVLMRKAARLEAELLATRARLLELESSGKIGSALARSPEEIQIERQMTVDASTKTTQSIPVGFL